MARSRAAPRAADETFAQRLVRRYVRAEFRGGEHVTPRPSGTVGAPYSLNAYLAASRASRWFTRWFALFTLLCCLVALFFVALPLFTGDVPFGGFAVLLTAFGLLVLVAAMRLQAGVRCLFRHRHAKRRPARR